MPPGKAADWLGLIAVWQIERLHDREAGRATLRRLIHDHPNTATAFAAQRRLLHLDEEDKVQQARAAQVRPRIRIQVDTKTDTA